LLSQDEQEKTIRRDKMFRFFQSALLIAALSMSVFAQTGQKETALDAKVKAFLDKMKYQWADLNVPEEDGQLLFDLVVKNNFKKALELGTSTGHSGIWIAWALSKTGGKLVTVEIDEGRHKQALANFKEAGLGDFIEARLADAHQVVEEIKGPFDFVFIDADKDWYTNYAKALIPKLEAGGCIAAHNVGERRGGYGGGTAAYYEYMKGLSGFETSMAAARSSLAVSYKKK
jgi:caffeoyl-CoA O-methyltransferase